jgi:hypothetical protein
LEISDLITKLESYRVRFRPSKEEYIRFLFEFNSRVVDKYYPKDNLQDHYNELKIMVKEQVQLDIQRAQYYYEKNNKFTEIWIPPIEGMDKLVNDYVKFYIKKLK